ncbi:YpdA family putative bacillithiol disulfide reductase [Sporosarcina sp. G11-34]|uniref:YpdA family putative bacillithiol disulfide reductase n=1 Tax=Sporosarcina sp. G11-34 TaxID=2849605 RepID=UPI0022A8E914|nr:YpdA family putative bacillithiol disulfide reductase [Sporosarcina sp. G11-34]MCZ2259482.1 YpdA family putative bacillithiol disulfide reductase [Sporosarcina sp. G11-34]
MGKDVIVIGGGPCGLSAAIELQNKGLDVLVIEKGNIVNSIYNYPTHQTFFSTSLKLSIGDIPFITAKDRPVRNDALVYYREVVKLKNIQVNNFEKVESVRKVDHVFTIVTDKSEYKANQVVVATGYYDNPNMMDIPGEDLPNVFHYFKEAHSYFQKKVVVIGGKNSAIDAALELERAGAFVTCVYRGSDYSQSVKPWILPGFESLVRAGDIDMHFNANVVKITDSTVTIAKEGEAFDIPNDYVFAMVGYHPDHSFLKEMGIRIDEENGRPVFNEDTMETNIEGLYIAGVIAAGNDANKIFIENGKFHGSMIAEAIDSKKKVSV